MSERVTIKTPPTNAPDLITNGVLQRKCAACSNHTIAGGGCSDCDKKNGLLQRKSASSEGVNEIPSIVHDVLHSSGQPLDAKARAFFEPKFAHDFSHVRVRTDAKAAESARAINARAYTVGENIVFGAGQFVPTSHTGQQLLAHELAHVVQQGNSQTAMQTSSLAISKPNDASERAADRTANQVMSGQSNGMTHSSMLAEANLVQRAIDYDECTSAEETVVLDSHNRAINMVANAVTKLRTYNGTTPANLKTALDTHFHSSGTGLAAWIAFNLAWLQGEADSPTYECEKPQVGSRLGWSMWCVPFTDIELYPLWFAESDIDIRATTMIHEWVHRYGCNFDLGYEWELGYSGHGTLRALLNADSWAHFVYDVR